MKNKKILSVVIVATLGVISLIGVTTATKTLSVLENGDIHICGTEYISNNGGVYGCITIQGKNVGATTTGFGEDAPITSYGNYYQWGDNTSHFYRNNIDGEWSGYGYGGGDSDYYVYDIPSRNVWGGENDNNELVYPVTNGKNRQGPCDTGYHVPSKGEWFALMDMWAEESVNGYIGRGSNASFFTDFQIPLAGRVALDLGYSWDDDILFDGTFYTGIVFLWSSSPEDGIDAWVLYGYDDNRWGYVDASGTFLEMSNAVPVRCFKNYDPNENGDSGSGSASTHVTLTLTAGSNTCTLNDYNLGTHNASAEEQYVESSGQDIVCEFLQNTGVIVLLSMDNLSDGSKLIGAENFTGVVTAIGNSLGSISNLTGGNYNLSGSQEIYRKAVNTLGKWTGDLQIVGTIPAGTPSGTYTGSLEIVIQEG